MRKFLIFAPPFDESSGGVVCLHKLCHILNQLGMPAWLHPSFENIEINPDNLWIPTLRLAREFYRKIIAYRTNPAFETPVYRGDFSRENTDNWIVIYYEQVFGNPLNARNVVRWLLHTPGYHTGKVYYGYNELHVKFNDGIRPFVFPNSKVSDVNLKVIHYPLDHYYQPPAGTPRSGIAYCIRKGKGKDIDTALRSAPLIDGKSHSEVGRILRSVETFVSYDTYTAYSVFAVLCGCRSIVVPDAGLSEQQWYPDPQDRYGIAYGAENADLAQQSAHLVLPRIESEHQASVSNTARFAQVADEYFDQPRYRYFRLAYAK